MLTPDSEIVAEEGEVATSLRLLASNGQKKCPSRSYLDQVDGTIPQERRRGFRDVFCTQIDSLDENTGCEGYAPADMTMETVRSRHASSQRAIIRVGFQSLSISPR